MVFIMIGLFAALSFTLSQGMRSGTSQLTDNQAMLAATEMIEYGQKIQQAIKGLMIGNGCADSEISFWYDDNGDGAENSSDLYYNANAPASKKCHLFRPEGGGLYFATPPNNSYSPVSGLVSYDHAITQKYFFDGRRPIMGVGTDAVNTGNDVTLRLQVTQNVCQQINNAFGITNIPLDNWPYFEFPNNINNTAGQAVLDCGGSCTGQRSMCFLQTGGPNQAYQFYYTVLVR
ncbi:MAG: hypothetical protein DI626_01675 [Micavibrio aeruginosavorus]|uniref:Uncharacterized protein n=1 Tax=Micavibrio aeruginosavorus TaxID=349221 RepID=A0A2W5BZI0_9BACT|nr:MAG: hypothetical protein DI626_01675 [Micavibrio aeruginosavorus]